MKMSLQTLEVQLVQWDYQLVIPDLGVDGLPEFPQVPLMLGGSNKFQA